METRRGTAHRFPVVTASPPITAEWIHGQRARSTRRENARPVRLSSDPTDTPGVWIVKASQALQRCDELAAAVIDGTLALSDARPRSVLRRTSKAYPTS